MGPAPSHCTAGYQTSASRAMRIRLRFCSGIRKIATRRPRAMLYQGSPYSCSVPPARSRAPSRKGTGSWGTGRALGRHLPRARTQDRGQDGPAETSQLCVPGWLPAPRLPPLPWPATLPAGPASCPCRNAPAGSGSDTCLLPDGQAAAGFSNPARQGPAEVSAVLPTPLRGEEVLPAPHTGLGCCCLVTNPPRERGELSCLLPLSETYSLDKDEYKQDFCPGPDITPSWRI